MGNCCSSDETSADHPPRGHHRQQARRRVGGDPDGDLSDDDSPDSPFFFRCHHCGHISNSRREVFSNHAEGCPVRLQLDLLQLILALQQQPRQDPIDLEPYSSRFRFSSQKKVGGRDHDDGINKCMVCLLEFEAGDDVRLLPCFHQFHTGCVDEWFKEHATCPICRFDPRHLSEGERSGGGSSGAHHPPEATAAASAAEVAPSPADLTDEERHMRAAWRAAFLELFPDAEEV